MQVQVIILVICTVLSVAFADVFFEEKFKDGMFKKKKFYHLSAMIVFFPSLNESDVAFSYVRPKTMNRCDKAVIHLNSSDFNYFFIEN